MIPLLSGSLTLAGAGRNRTAEEAATFAREVIDRETRDIDESLLPRAPSRGPRVDPLTAWA